MREYLIVIERADHNFSAYSPDLPGCVATGQTAEETEQAMREAILWHIEGLREDGDPIPEPRAIARTVAVASLDDGPGFS